MPDISSRIKDRVVHSAEAIRSEMSDILRMACEPVFAGEHIGELIRRAAVRLGLNYGKARRLWYGEVLTIAAHEADMLREQRAAILKQRLRALDAEAAILRARLGEADT